MTTFVQRSLRTGSIALLARFSAALVSWCWFCAVASAAQLASDSRHVVVVVWDGMRPDLISEQNTPTLWNLSRNGVTFRNHHCVYPSMTMVNGTALVTGVYPGRNGITANHIYRYEIDPKHPIDVELPATVAMGDQLSAGKYISVPTLAELVRSAGGRTVVASAKTVGLLLDRQFGVRQLAGALGEADDTFSGAKRQPVAAIPHSVTVFAGKSVPPDVCASITGKLGAFPSAHIQQDTWTTKALTDVLGADGVPALSILWLGEPDLTQHESAPGAPDALAAIKSADDNLAVVLRAVDQRHARETTNVFVVSDHGFSTIERSIDLRKILNNAGLAATTEFTGEPKPGDIILAGNGGSVLFYVIGHDEKIIRRLVEFLQQSDFASMIFTRQPLEGTFSFDQAKLGNDHAPDVVMAFRWNDSKNQFGVPGMIDADWQRAAGKGTHGTLSRFDMHNMLIAAGPDFRQGETDDLPTGNTDLAPTIWQILGNKPPANVDGRVLSEAVANRNEPGAKQETRTIHATRNFLSGTWRQTLRISRVGTTVYIDQGNGSFERRK